ncbi:MAG: hypothetical protein DMG97_16720 [Acidobacteria bacterium]|nr:MAG: hypothetical protein DMG97_16720 [Acidobacteriota bacterium]
MLIGVLLLVPSSEGQSNTASGQSKSTGPSIAAQDPGQVIQFLSRTISWHRQLEAEGKNANRATDLSFAQEDLHIADQVVRLAFEYARGQVQLQAKQSAPSPQSAAPDDNSAQFQRLAQATQKVEQDIQDTQVEVQGVRQKLARAPENKRPAIESQVAELQSEIGLLDARRDALQSMSQFVTSSNSAGSGGLHTQIEELARSVPAD